MDSRISISEKAERNCSSEKFENENQLIQYAIKSYNEIVPKPFALAKGSWCVADPQEILVGPEDFKTQVNILYTEAKNIGGYEQNEQRCSELFHQYQRLLKTYKL